MPRSFKAVLQPRHGKLALQSYVGIGVAALIYVVLFYIGLHRIGAQAASFAYVFIAVVSWLYGFRCSLFAVFLCICVSAIFFYDVQFSQIVVGNILFFSVAYAVSLVSSLYVKLRLTESLLREEHEKSEMILSNIFPKKIMERLKNGEALIADRYLETTILFSDLVGFTDLTKTMKPHDLVSLLNKVITGFDQLSEQLHIEKIKTIGDAYLVVSGLPDENSNHAPDVSRMALEMLKFIEDFNRTENMNLQIRIGIHSGAVIGGIIGPKKFTFDLWGDTVNLASRLETTGLPGKIQVSQTTYELLQKDFIFEAREPIDVKGHGKVQTYFLLGTKE